LRSARMVDATLGQGGSTLIPSAANVLS
jgi:hypothetical protein